MSPLSLLVLSHRHSTTQSRIEDAIATHHVVIGLSRYARECGV